MAIKNYYVVLGVPSTESPVGIRTAFRELAKRYHPDRAGAGTEARFREITEAYEVLSDPERRRLYNQNLREAERPAIPAREPPEIRSTWPEPEPLLRKPRSLFRDRASVHPSIDELHESFTRNFPGRGISAARPLETIDVVLSPEEAIQGAVLRIVVPLLRRCPACGGSGWNWSFPCVPCGQWGFLEEEETVEIELPPFVRSGTIIEVPLREWDVRNLVLQVHVQIGRWGSS
ncbi:MAG TPA: DnaJ domain-containing protein [Candidatus Binatia bacterium]|nr:DnaJ domain-containing protein [Candidatus Binatia bacterium]